MVISIAFFTYTKIGKIDKKGYVYNNQNIKDMTRKKAEKTEEKSVSRVKPETAVTCTKSGRRKPEKKKEEIEHKEAKPKATAKKKTATATEAKPIKKPKKRKLSVEAKRKINPKTNPAVQNRMKEDKEKFLKEFKNQFGVVNIACEKVGISRAVVYQWKQDDEEFAKAFELCKERPLDVAQQTLYWKAFVEKDAKCIMFILDRKGKDLGWGANAKVELAGEVTTNLAMPKLTAEQLEKLKKINGISAE